MQEDKNHFSQFIDLYLELSYANCGGFRSKRFFLFFGAVGCMVRCTTHCTSSAVALQLHPIHIIHMIYSCLLPSILPLFVVDLPCNKAVLMDIFIHIIYFIFCVFDEWTNRIHTKAHIQWKVVGSTRISAFKPITNNDAIFIGTEWM